VSPGVEFTEWHCYSDKNDSVLEKRQPTVLQSSTVTQIHVPVYLGTSTTPTLTAEDNGPAFSDQSFRSIGLEPNLVQALQKAFPNIKRPTKVQESLITEILAGRDILLKDSTGSGK
jgi:hypothetical protein